MTNSVRPNLSSARSYFLVTVCWRGFGLSTKIDPDVRGEVRSTPRSHL